MPHTVVMIMKQNMHSMIVFITIAIKRRIFISLVVILMHEFSTVTVRRNRRLVHIFSEEEQNTWTQFLILLLKAGHCSSIFVFKRVYVFLTQFFKNHPNINVHSGKIQLTMGQRGHCKDTLSWIFGRLLTNGPQIAKT